LKSFFDHLGSPLATHRDIRHAKTIVVIGGEPEELQPFTGKQIRQAVRNGGAKLVIVNSVRIRLNEQATKFVHIRAGSEEAIVLALADAANDSLAGEKGGHRGIRDRRRAPVDRELRGRHYCHVWW
jgi:predicted molibdopterin-dependent oxidoreductase YjgC